MDSDQIKGDQSLGILSRVKISPQQRFDLEDLFAMQSSERTDSKLWTQKFLSELNLIMGGFTVSGVGLNSATVAMANSSLIIPQNTSDFSFFFSFPSEPDVVISDADLVDSSRNYLEVELVTQDGTPLTKAFWDPETNSGLGAEFNQTVNTMTDLYVNFVTSTSGFSGSPERLPIAVIDTDGSGIIKVILDRRELFGRLAKPDDLDNEYNWGLRIDPVFSLNMTGTSGTFTAGETITIGGETATVVTGGTSSITFNAPTGINFGNGDSVTGGSSGATGTVNTVEEAFLGADKSLQGQKEINDALMTEIKTMKGTRFWFQTSPTLSGIKNEIASLIAPITVGARVKWNGSALVITDDNNSPADNQVLAAIRLLGSTANLQLTRQDDGKEVTTISFASVPDTGILVIQTGAFQTSIDWNDSTSDIQTAWNGSGAYAATISGSPAAQRIVITANAAGLRTDISTFSNSLQKSGVAVTPTYSIKQGMAADGSIALSDGQFLYVDLPNPVANQTYDGIGSGAANFKVAARGSLSITDQAYWLAYREGSKLVWRFAGELEAGESTQISDNIAQGILDAIGLASETSMPSYDSNIRGQAQESIVKRSSVLTDAMGDAQEDRSAFLRSDDVIGWDGSAITLNQNLILEIKNTKSGTTTLHTLTTANSPISIADGESIWVLVDRALASQTLTLKRTTVDAIPAQTQANKDVFVLFYRHDASGDQFLHIPLHKQVLTSGQETYVGASGGSDKNGRASIANAATSVSVVFDKPFKNSFYALVHSMENVTDSAPQFQTPITTAKSAAGFTASWNAPTDSANYYLSFKAGQMPVVFPSLSNLVLRWKASQVSGVLNGGLITSPVTDLSPTLNHALVGASGVKYFASAANGKPTFGIPITDQPGGGYLIATNNTSYSQVTIMFVTKWLAGTTGGPGGFNAMFGKEGAYGTYVNNTTGELTVSNNSVSTSFPSTLNTNTAFRRITWTVNNGVASGSRVYVDSSELTGSPFTFSIRDQLVKFTLMNIAGYPNIGYIPEVVVFDRILTAGEIAQVDDYFKAEYSL